MAAKRDEPEMEERNNDNIPSDAELEAAKVEEYLEGMPPINIGALLMPPIWGPAKGLWLTILWYPLWIFADNCLFTWWSQGTPLATIVGILTLVFLIAATVGFARLSAPYAALKAVQKGKTKEEFQRGERMWIVIGAIIAVLFLAVATYYNLCVRVPFTA